MRYAVIFEKSRTGYSCYSPDLPGCIAAAATLEETKRLMAEAMEGHLELIRECGDPIPEATTETAYIEAA